VSAQVFVVYVGKNRFFIELIHRSTTRAFIMTGIEIYNPMGVA
jgi:hypothetical protein